MGPRTARPGGQGDGDGQSPALHARPVDADEPLASPAPMLSTWTGIRRAYLPEASIWASWSIAPFYAALLLVGIGVLITAMN